MPKVLIVNKELTLNQSTKFWTGPNLKAFADDKIIVWKIENCFGKDRRHLGKPSHRYFLLFPQYFCKASFLWGSLQVGIERYRVKDLFLVTVALWQAQDHNLDPDIDTANDTIESIVMKEINKHCYEWQEDHDGPISLTWVLNSTG